MINFLGKSQETSRWCESSFPGHSCALALRSVRGIGGRIPSTTFYGISNNLEQI